MKAAPITPELRKQVETMAGLGLRDEDIANVVGLGEATIQRHCRLELKRGRARATAAVANTAYRLAVGGQCPAATFFWMKCRAGWREVAREVPVTDEAKGLAIE